jgi:tetratricopeptide (TPR) repeat protein
MKTRALWIVPFFAAPLFFLSGTSAQQDDWKKKNKAQEQLIRARRAAADYKMDKAADEARQALKNDPSLAEAHVYVGLHRLREDDVPEAEAAFRRALDLDSYCAPAHCYLGYVFYRQGNFDQAQDHWSLAIKLDSKLPHSYIGMALSLHRQGERESAARTYEKAFLYDRRFADPKFLASDKGPRWRGDMLREIEEILTLVQKPKYPY